MHDLERKLKQPGELFSNSMDLTDSDRYMILAVLATDSASSLVITSDGKFHRYWIADDSSGYSSEIINAENLYHGQTAFLEKPYSMEELSDAIILLDVV
jgi:hypothetical protein